MKKLLTIMIIFFVFVGLFFISNCRKQEDGPIPPTLTPTLNATQIALTAAPTRTMQMAETETVVAGYTPTATPTPFTLTYDFESSLDGWSLGGDAGFLSPTDVAGSSVPNSAGAYSGSYCAQLTCNFTTSVTKGEFEVVPSKPYFGSETSVTMHVFIPGGMPAAYTMLIYVFGSGYAWNPSPSYSVSNLTSNAWNTLSYSLSGATGLSNVPKFGLQVIADGTTSWSGTIYLDDVLVQ
jgi:hypothetical protein